MIRTRVRLTALAASIALIAAPGIVLAEDSGWGVGNPGTPYYSGTGSLGWNGNCYGMVRAEIEYMRLGLDRDRSFREVTTPASTRTVSTAEQNDPVARQMAKTSDHIFVEQFAALAQDYTTRNRDWNQIYNDNASTPREMASSLSAVKTSADNPQLLLMRNPENKTAHAVMVRSVDEDNQHINFRLRDPNHPGQESLLRYDKNTRGFEGYPQYKEFMHDQSALPDNIRAELRALVEGASADGTRRRLPVFRLNNSRSRRPFIEPPAPSGALNRNISAVNDPEVGGVRLYFDPAIVETEGNDEARMRMLWNLNRELTTGETDVIACVEGELELRAESLRSILASEATSVGSLTRILGFVQRAGDDDFYILGKSEPGVAPIPLEILTVALKEAWINNNNPAISLDPDPTDCFGPQHVRLEEITDENRNTRFVEIMLEADFRMKHVLFKDQEYGSEVPGFLSTYQLFQRNPPAQQGTRQARYWLNPRSTVGADVFVNRYKGDEGDEGATVVYFESDIRVSTEEMMDAMTLPGSSQVNSIDEEAARLFTNHYEGIEANYPIFRDLRGVFDATKLAVILRMRGVEHPLLREAAARAVPVTPIRTSYDGLGPLWIEGTSFFIGGGCVTVDEPPRRGGGKGIETPLVREIVSVAPGVLQVSLLMPGSIPLSQEAALDLLREAEIELAAKEIAENRHRDAVDRLTRLIDRIMRTGDTSLAASALPHRAVAWLGLGETAKALKDVQQIDIELPVVQSFRGLVRLFNGDAEGAYRDIIAAAKEDSHDRQILENKAQVEMLTLRLDDASRTLDQLIAFAPGNPEIAMLEFNITLLRRIGPTKAKERVRQYLATPFAITLALEEGQLLGLSGRVSEGIARIEGALDLMRAPTKELMALHLEERAWVALLSLYEIKRSVEGTNDEDERKISAIITRLTSRRPTWPSAWLAKLGYGTGEGGGSPQERLDLFRKAVTLKPEGDPLLEEMAILFGCDARAYYGIQFIPELFTALGRHKISLDDCQWFAKKLASYFDTGPEQHVLAVLNDHIASLKKIEQIMRKYGASPEKRPDPETERKVEAEAKRIFGEDIEQKLGVAGMQARMLSMPPPKAGSGVVTLQIIGKYYLPAMMEQTGSLLTKVMSDETERGDFDREVAEVRSRLLSGIALFDIEWSSMEAVKRAAGGLNAMYMLYATTTFAEIDKEPAREVMEADAKRGELRPEVFLAALDKSLDDAIARDRDASPGLKAFIRSMGQTLVVDGIKRMRGFVQSAEPAWDDNAGRERWTALMSEWDEAEREAKANFSLFRQMVEDMPLKRPMDVLMAQQLLTAFEKMISTVATDMSEMTRYLRDLNETRARLDLRLAATMRDR